MDRKLLMTIVLLTLLSLAVFVAARSAIGDGEVISQVTYSIYLFEFNFLGGQAPSLPFPSCGSVALLESDRIIGCKTLTRTCH